MVIVLTDLGNVGIDIDVTQDTETGEFRFRTWDGTQFHDMTSTRESLSCQISRDDLLNDDYLPRNDITREIVPTFINMGASNLDLTMNPTSLFEAWCLNVNVPNPRNNYVRFPVTIYLDIFRHQLILNNLPLMEVHGWSIRQNASQQLATVVSHAQTYWEHQSRFREGEVLDPTGGDTMVDTGVGFCKPPSIENNQIKFCLLAPPSRHRLRSDHLQWSNIKGDKQPEGIRALLTFQENYGIDHLVNVPAHTENGLLIRRYIAYNDETFIASSWYRYNNLNKQFEFANDVLDNQDTVFNLGGGGVRVFDDINLLAPEINAGRCV